MLGLGEQVVERFELARLLHWRHDGGRRRKQKVEKREREGQKPSVKPSVKGLKMVKSNDGKFLEIVGETIYIVCENRALASRFRPQPPFPTACAATSCGAAESKRTQEQA
jgi:hypothetical protein